MHERSSGKEGATDKNNMNQMERKNNLKIGGEEVLVPWMSWVGNGCWSAPNVDWSTPNETANMLARFLN